MWFESRSGGQIRFHRAASSLFLTLFFSLLFMSDVDNTNNVLLQKKYSSSSRRKSSTTTLTAPFPSSSSYLSSSPLSFLSRVVVVSPPKLLLFADAQYGTIELYVDHMWKIHNGTWLACFGWDNPNSMTISIPADPDTNYMEPEDGSYMGDPVPESFDSGRHKCQFQAQVVKQQVGRKDLAWHLVSLNNQSRVVEVVLP